VSKTTILPEAPPARDVLSQSEAVARAGRVREARYRIELDLRAGDATYRGAASLQFETSGSGPLFIDFRGRHIERLTVNGSDLEPDWTGFRIILPSAVVTEAMTVRLIYENDFDTTGDGFHRFVDPEDGEEYVYTNFEPFEAHRLFPCFDQPDIKGRYTFDVTAPAAWAVVANSPIESVDRAGDGRLRRLFEQTEPFSTYLAAVACGPYVSRTREHRGVPLGIYARRSMERQLEEHAAEIFEITAQGMDFFGDLFDRPYPFAKYDQLFVPEYNAGAMENVGAVTYNESYLFREPPTDKQRLDRGEVLLHELAHMWFGNLVTMRWWDDLWPNESFATYIAFLGLTEATRFTNAWKVFNTDLKRWAYQQDQLITTHPIAGTAEDTEVAFLNFDGITYGKGAAALKQLVKTIGRDAFRDGMRLYFRRHAWGNATLRDFLACLEEAGGRPLGEWARLWLETASLNTITVDWRGEGDRLAELTLMQSAPAAHDTLRPHALEVALGREEGGRLVVDTVPAAIEGSEAGIGDAAGRPLPVFVYANYGDHAYAKIALDHVSLEYVRAHLDQVEDVLLRQLLWMSLWEMVRDCQLKSTDFVAICRASLDREPDMDVLDAGLGRMALAIARYVPEARRQHAAHEAFSAALVNLAAAEGDSQTARNGDAQILWARSAIATAVSGDDVERLLELLDGQPMATGFTFDQEMRWGIVTKAVAHGLRTAEQRLAVESARDPSDRGRRALIMAQASRPLGRAKEQAWQRIHSTGYGSFHFTRAAMQGFFWPHQAELLEPYVPRFFERVREVFATRDHPYARSYLTALYPAYRAQLEVLARSRRLLDSLDGSLPTLSRQLAEAADELERQIGVRAFAED